MSLQVVDLMEGERAVKRTSEMREKRWLALALLCVAHLLGVVDVSIVNVALPSVGKDLGFSPEDLQWVINAYILAFGGFLLLGGRIADLLGRRRVFVGGLVIFSVASLACGLAPSAWVLVAARAVQGLGGAILVPSALSIVATTFKGAERNRALGIFGAVGGLGFTVGVLLGGFITGSLGWEWVFFVNVPVGIAAAILAPFLIPESRAETTQAGSRSFDLAGALTVTAGLAILVYAVAGAGETGLSTGTLGLLALAAGFLVAFIIAELRAVSPLVPLGVFRTRTLTGANAVAALAGAGATSVFFFVSLYLQQVLGFDPLATGFAFVPLALAIVVGANVASGLVTRYGAGTVLTGGLLILAISFLWLGQIDADGSYLVDVLFPSLLAGFGVGCSVVPATIAAVGALPAEKAGLTSGLITTAQQVGGALGLATLVAIAAARTSAVAGAAGANSTEEALTAGFRAALVSGAALALIGSVLALVLVRGLGPSDGDRADKP